jgi:hypothetical protein
MRPPCPGTRLVELETMRLVCLGKDLELALRGDLGETLWAGELDKERVRAVLFEPPHALLPSRLGHLRSTDPL